MPRNDSNTTHSRQTNLTRPEPVDYFFSTQYTASTVNKMLEIYNEVKDMMLCRFCNTNCVDTKL